MEMNLFTMGLGGVLGQGKTGPLLGESDFLPLEGSLRGAERTLREGSAQKKAGFGWMRLPYEDIGPILAISGKLREFDSIVQVGIGGSSLGNLMLNNAFLHPYHNELTRKERKAPRFYMADNPDPSGVQAILDCIDPERTGFVVVSKSGSTAETVSLFLRFYAELAERGGAEKALSNFFFVTDPEKGCLRELAQSYNCPTLPVPVDVGGRFSVLSPVGLLSSAALGIPVGEILEGARLMDDRIKDAESLWENPAWILAALHYLHFERNRPMTVLMPYCDGLERFAEWYAQLWGESLGKGGKGSTPIRALGAIDQHSQVQLYVDGPDDKLFTLIDVAEKGPKITIPSLGVKELNSLSYLEGHTFSELLSVEARSTASALLKAKRPVVWVKLEKLDGRSMGALIFLYEMVTALTGLLFKVDPFDQPGVEQGKRYTYGLMGKSGYRDDADEAAEGFGKILGKTLSV